MKILLVLEKEITKTNLVVHLRPRGFEFIHYRNPIKAMDNIDEIDPDIVLFSAEDFPRHWKPFLRLLRDEHTKEDTVFILFVGDDFPFEEAAKAVHLNANGIINEDLRDNRKMLHIEGLLSRYKMLKDRRDDHRYIPDSYDEIEFLFTHPESMKLITGSIENISISGIRFLPDNPRLTADIEEGSEIPFCSLRVSDHIMSIQCLVIRNDQEIAFQYENLSDRESEIIKKYMDARPERELKMLFKDKNPYIHSNTVNERS